MTTMSYRPEWWPEKPNGDYPSVPYGLFELCDIVHADSTGQLAGHESIRPQIIASYVRALEHVRDNWKEPSSMYERAVRTLVVRTLNERKPKVDTPPDCIRVAVPRSSRPQAGE